MIVYNITIKIQPEIETEWVNWQKTEHIPDIMASGQFSSFKFYRLIEVEEDGITYVVQYFADTPEIYQHYIDEYSPRLRQKAHEKWGNQFIAFRTVMELVH